MDIPCGNCRVLDFLVFFFSFLFFNLVPFCSSFPFHRCSVEDLNVVHQWRWMSPTASVSILVPIGEARRQELLDDGIEKKTTS